MARKFFYICAGIFLLSLAWHLGAASAGAIQKRIVTRELVVTDDAGRQRATITVDIGGPHLSLSNESGYPTVMLTGASLTDKSERVRFGHGPYGGCLAFFDPERTLRAQVGFRLESGPDGWPSAGDEPGVVLYGKDGKRTWSAMP